MKNPHDNFWVPDDGYRYLTNGEIWSESIYLGKADNISNWHDTNEEPSESEDDPSTDDDPSLEDKAEAYDILMGVET